MFGNKDYSDDLINEKVEPIIIKQDGSNSDKKFIYTIIILLVVLFILALGVIAFLGSKYFSSQNNKNAFTTSAQTTSQNSAQPIAQQEREAIKKAIIAKPKKVEVTTQTDKENSDADDLNKLFAQEKNSQSTQSNTNVQKTVSAVANKVTGSKLSKEDLSKIAKLVAAELKKANTNTNTQTKTNTKSKDNSLIQALQAAPTDTLKEQDVDVSKIAKGDVKAKASTKKVDTFNKVVVQEKKSGDDEFAKLTQEIDSILQSKDVQEAETKNKYNKLYQQETAQREKELRFYTVRQGDTLSSIARKAYGKASLYRKIYEANPDLIKNPNRIYIGMKLRVPAL